jgi:uncharacterized protein (DUF433 family)
VVIEVTVMHAPAKNHIMIDDKGVARVEGTPFKVRMMIEGWMANGRSVEALQRAYPRLSLAQIHAALAYYYDHQAEFDAEIERQGVEFEAARAEFLESPAGKRLRELKAQRQQQQ